MGRTTTKLLREIARIAAQAARLHRFLLGPLQKAFHDLRRDRRLTLTNGAAPLGPEIALVLLHQPAGLLHSTWHMLAHLRSRGLCLLIVSNAPLPRADRDKLRRLAWRIIERPNFGYDFGGYRDGILHLLTRGIRPERLFVLNDSVWFPLRGDSDLVDRARAADADLYGFAMNDTRPKARQRHLQSYFLVFSGRLVGHADFRRFWTRLFLSDDKEQVIRRCEIVLTRYFADLGHSVACRFTGADTATARQALDDDALRTVLGYLAELGAPNAAQIRQMRDTEIHDAAWRSEALAALDPAETRLPVIRAHPAILIAQLDAPLLKKTRDPRYRAQRAALLEMGLEAGFAPAIRDEIRGWDAVAPSPPSKSH